MAQDSDVPKAADKGKGKAVDDSKDEKSLPLINGKKEDDKKDCMYIIVGLVVMSPVANR
jgi:desulfoferrodoxin (superoxide reductase-like protein)